MSQMRVIGLGMATVDVLVRLAELPTWEHGSHFSAIALDGGGPVATALAAVARLGVGAGFIGAYGNDRLGDLKRQMLVECGVDVSQMVRLPAPENEVVLVAVHATTGERIFTGCEAFWEHQLLPDQVSQAYCASAEFLHLDGYHPAAALAAARWMHAAGKTVVLDGSATAGPIPDSMRALVAESDILICGSGFGHALTGSADVWAAGRAMVELGPRIVVQTEGKAGSFTVTRDDAFHTPAFEVPVVDTTGAGDVFHGAYIVGLLAGWDVRRTAQFATAVAALKCTGLGGRRPIPRFDQVMAFLKERGIGW
jgi:ribokinase